MKRPLAFTLIALGCLIWVVALWYFFFVGQEWPEGKGESFGAAVFFTGLLPIAAGVVDITNKGGGRS